MKTNTGKGNLFYVGTLLALALVIGFASLQFTPELPERPDTAHYTQIARSLAGGNGFSDINSEPTARYAPGYPFLLSLVYMLGGGFGAMYIVQVVLLAGIGLFSYLIAQKFLSRTFAFLSAVNVAVWPYLLFYTKFILTEIVFIFALMASAYVVLRFLETPTKKGAALSGAAIGITTLIRPITLLLPIWLIGLALLLAIIFKDKEVLSGWKYWVLGLAAFIAVLTPWTIRNALEFKAFIPVTSGFEDTAHRAYKTLNYTTDSVALEQATLKDNILARAKNIYLFWNPGAGGTNAEFLRQTNPFFNMALLGYKILFIITVLFAALAFLFKKNKGMVVLSSFILYFWVVHTLLYPYPRYTLPIMPLVIILAWGGIYFLLLVFRSKRNTRP